MPIRIKVNVPCPDGTSFEVEHALPGPWTVKEFPTGFCAVLNGNDMNWIRFPDAPGAVLVGPETAKVIAKALNEHKP